LHTTAPAEFKSYLLLSHTLLPHKAWPTSQHTPQHIQTNYRPVLVAVAAVANQLLLMEN
jgi:hypothetical protein